MADYNSSYTGPQIDEGVGTARAAGAASGILKSDGAGGISAAVAGEDYASPSSVSSIYSTITASGSAVTFDAEAAGLPIKDMTVSIEPVQSGSGTPTPANIRPISGFDVAHIYVGATQVVADATAYTVQLQAVAGTVYHGTLNPITGELTVDKVLFTIDGSAIGATGTASSSGAKYARTTVLPSATYDRGIIDLCDTYPIVTAAPTTSNVQVIRFATNGYIYLYDKDFGTEEQIKAALNANPVHVLLRLTTPVTYELSPVEIETILGSNVVWSDAGDVSVTYGAYLAAVNDHADRVNASLLKLMACIAPIENGATASQAYAQGAYFFHNGDFCKAKTAISSGAAFTLDTNYEITTVSAAIVALQS